MLQESAKRRREDSPQQEDGKSTHSTTPDTSSSSPESASQKGELLTPSEDSSRDRTPSGPVPSAGPAVTAEGEDLFKAAPDDDFFEIVAKESIEELADDEAEAMAEGDEVQEQLELGQDALTTTGGGYDQNGGLHVPETHYADSSSPGSEGLIATRNEGVLGQVVRNKILEKPLTDGYIDSDVSSTEENINASYGSLFNKVWPRGSEEHAHANNSDSEQHSSHDGDLGHQATLGHVETAPPNPAPSHPASQDPSSLSQTSYGHNANSRPDGHPTTKAMGINPVSQLSEGTSFVANLPSNSRVGSTAGLLSSDRCDSDLTYPTAATSFKTRAMSGSSRTPSTGHTGAVRAGQAACFTRTVSPRQGHEVDLPPEKGGYKDDICERTDALNTTFSTFKVKLPSSSGMAGGSRGGPRGMLDDALPSGGESDY